MKKTMTYPIMQEMIDKHGWVITGVPGLIIYTIGLIDKFQHPELLIHGLNPTQSESILRCAVDCVKDGVKFIPGSLHTGVVRDYKVKPLRVDPSNYHDWLGQALDYHGRSLDVLQLLWPDTNLKYPGDKGYEKRFDCQKRFDVRRPEY